MRSLKERQKEWDEDYNSNRIANEKDIVIPPRPSKEEDEKVEKMISELKNTPSELRKRSYQSQEEEIFASRSDGGKLNYILTNLIHQEIDFELKKCLTDRSTRIVSLTKETPYGIAHFDQLISISDIANNRLSFTLEQGISDIGREEKKLYDSRREYTIPGSRNFFNRKY